MALPQAAEFSLLLGSTANIDSRLPHELVVSTSGS